MAQQSMFWLDYAFHGDEGRKRLEKLCEDPDTTLEDVLSDPDFMHEARSCNGKLVTYLTSERVLREMFTAILNPSTDEKRAEDATGTEEEQKQAADKDGKNLYKKTSQCTDAICQTASHIFREMKKYPDLIDELLNFLDAPAMNHLLVTFPIKVIANFLNQEPEEFIPMLEASDFLRKCWGSLHYSAIFELLCTMISCLPDFTYRERIKKWFVRERFVDALLAALSKDSTSEYHENAASIWQEFVQALRENQCNVEVTEDPLLDSLQGRESVNKLLAQMFPVDVMSYSPSIIASGAGVINVLLETNYIKGCPSQALAQDSLDGRWPTVDLTQTTPDLTIDPGRVVETCVAEWSAQLVRSLLKAAYAPREYHQGDVLARCLQVLVHLVNTNHLPTHLRLLATLRCEESSLDRLCEAFFFNPTCSVYASNLDNFIAYVLYSEMPDGSPSPIAKHFFSEDVNLPRIIRTSFRGVDEVKPLLKKVSMRGWLMRIAQRVCRCQQIKPGLKKLAKALPDSEAWDEFVNSTVHAFAEMNRPQRTPSRTRSSTIIEVDELKDMSLVVEQVGGRVAVGGIVKPAAEKHHSLTTAEETPSASDEPMSAVEEASSKKAEEIPPASDEPMKEEASSKNAEETPPASDEPMSAVEKASSKKAEETPPASDKPMTAVEEASSKKPEEIPPASDEPMTAVEKASSKNAEEIPPASDEPMTAVEEASSKKAEETPPASDEPMKEADKKPDGTAPASDKPTAMEEADKKPDGTAPASDKPTAMEEADKKPED